MTLEKKSRRDTASQISTIHLDLLRCLRGRRGYVWIEDHKTREEEKIIEVVRGRGKKNKGFWKKGFAWEGEATQPEDE